MVVFFAALAAADQRGVNDPTNPDQVVDPIHARHGHLKGNRRVLVHTFTATAPGFSMFEAKLSIWTRRGGRGRPDRRVIATPNEIADYPSGLMSTSWRAVVLNRSGRIIGHANAWFFRPEVFRIELHRQLLGRGVKRYRWALEVRSPCQPASEGALCGGPKRDRVPDRGSVLHVLGP